MRVPTSAASQRQQDFIRRLAGLAVRKSLSNPLTANEIAGNVVSHLKVDAGLSKDDIFALIDAFRGINPDDTSALDFETFQGRLGTARRPVRAVPARWTRWRRCSTGCATFDTGAAASSVSPSDVHLARAQRLQPGRAGEGGADRLRRSSGSRARDSDNDPRGTVSVGEIRYREGRRRRRPSSCSRT